MREGGGWGVVCVRAENLSHCSRLQRSVHGAPSPASADGLHIQAFTDENAVAWQCAGTRQQHITQNRCSSMTIKRPEVPVGHNERRGGGGLWWSPMSVASPDSGGPRGCHWATIALRLTLEIPHGSAGLPAFPGPEV